MPEEAASSSLTTPIDLAKLIIMSGAYEHNWQNKTDSRRPSNSGKTNHHYIVCAIKPVSGTVVSEFNRIGAPRRGWPLQLRRHLSAAQRPRRYKVSVKLEPLRSAPDAIQFDLMRVSPDQICLFGRCATQMGVEANVLVRFANNSGAVWIWEFLLKQIKLPRSRTMLIAACDVRFPARLSFLKCASRAR